MSVDDTQTTAMIQRQLAIRAVRETVGLLITSLVIGTAFVGPLFIVLAGAVPQVALMLPEPARVATIYLDGFDDSSETLAQGGGGEEEAILDLDEGGPGDGEEEAAAGPEAADPTTPEPELPEETPPEATEPVEPKPKPKEDKPASDKPKEEKPKEPTKAEEPEAPDAEADRPASGGSAQTRGPRPKHPGRCTPGHKDITRVSTSTYKVKRTLIEYYTKDMRRFNSLGYSKKYHEEGKKGWLIGGFGCISPLWKGGLRSQDVIQSVNGKKTYNIVHLFGIWTSQRKKSDFEIKLLRGGKPMTLRYKVI